MYYLYHLYHFWREFYVTYLCDQATTVFHSIRPERLHRTCIVTCIWPSIARSRCGCGMTPSKRTWTMRWPARARRNTLGTDAAARPTCDQRENMSRGQRLSPTVDRALMPLSPGPPLKWALRCVVNARMLFWPGTIGLVWGPMPPRGRASTRAGRGRCWSRSAHRCRPRSSRRRDCARVRRTQCTGRPSCSTMRWIPTPRSPRPPAGWCQ